jgi:hypothetical protein
MKKLKIGNLLKFIIVSIVLLTLVFLIFLFDSYNIPNPKMEIYPDDVLVEFTSVQNNHEEPLQSETDIISFYSSFSQNHNNTDTVQDIFVIDPLQQSPFHEYQEIDFLQRQKTALEEHVKKLENENKRLSEINHETKRELAKFFERNRYKDIILSAIVGAFTSALLIFILGLPLVKNKITQYFFDEK